MDDPLGRSTPAVIHGAPTASNHMIMELAKHTVAFAHQYRENRQDATALAHAAQKVEGSLLGLQAISALPQEQAEALIVELYELLNAVS